MLEDTGRYGLRSMPGYLRQRRQRLPLVVFVLLLILCLLLLGFACVCASDHHAQAIERMVTAIATLPPLIELWSLAFAAMLAVSVIYAVRRPAFGRASPAELQRFLF